jgi:vesicle transport through interaction with t-SNAREs protein 1
LDRTSARITNTQRIADETEQIGSGVLTELGSQRDTIVRVAHKVQGVDANLSKSKRILNGMSRRVMTNQVTMIIIIFVLCAILGIVIWSKYLNPKK